jgi:2-polyprenyl-6-methoxyphenol hydroxylase-like FAD-dependent oxidoreductase
VPLARIPGQRLAGPEYPANVGISRRALHKVLSETAIALGVGVRLGLSVETWEQDASGVELFTDGSHGRYGLVVGADGLFSKVRGLLFGDKYQPRFTGQSVWRYNFPRAAQIDHLANYQGPSGNAGLCRWPTTSCTSSPPPTSRATRGWTRRPWPPSCASAWPASAG